MPRRPTRPVVPRAVLAKLRAICRDLAESAWGTLWGTKVIGMTIDEGTDWDEVAVVVTERPIPVDAVVRAATVDHRRRSRS